MDTIDILKRSTELLLLLPTGADEKYGGHLEVVIRSTQCNQLDRLNELSAQFINHNSLNTKQFINHNSLNTKQIFMRLSMIQDTYMNIKIR